MKTCKSTLFVISLLFLVTNIGCKDSCDGIDTSPQTITYLIEEDAKAKFPFKDKDTQIYISNLGDTAVLFGKLYTWYETNNSSRMVECSKPITTHGEKMSYYATGNNPELNRMEYILRAKIYNFAGENVFDYCINENIDGGSSPKSPMNNDLYYTDSIIVFNKYIYGIYLPQDPPIAILFYNYHFGFLKIEFVSGKTWTKII
ncbi:MAG: hypothetical protein KA981_07135 [Bacteroidia bacterium]|nr:hypothetical protein [Bacteroidia bacterium]